MVDLALVLMSILGVVVYFRIHLYNTHIISLLVLELAVVLSPSEVVLMVWDLEQEVVSVEMEEVAVMDILFLISLQFFVLLG